MPAPPRYIIEVFLYGIEPRIWRRLSLPAGTTFAGLHAAIQDAMGWERKYLHEFRHGKGKRLMDVIGPDDEEVPKGDSFREESTVTVGDFVGRRKLPIRFLYRYDFRDDWVHEVTIAERDDGGAGDGPVLLGGERACPPEDCGGAEGYMAALGGDLEWLDDNYDPARFDPKKVKFGRMRGSQ